MAEFVKNMKWKAKWQLEENEYVNQVVNSKTGKLCNNLRKKMNKVWLGVKNLICITCGFTIAGKRYIFDGQPIHSSVEIC